MPGHTVQGMVPLLEELRRSIEVSTFTIRGENRPARKPPRKARTPGGREQLGVTVSIGVARKSPLHSTVDGVVNAADEALYRAKQMGRNRVEPERRNRPWESYARRITCGGTKSEQQQGDKGRFHLD
jgi:GGDEF domain-containing protein